MKIFSYGSNMHENRIRQRVPSARAVGIGSLLRYRLECVKRSTDGSGKATIVHTGSPEDQVWGVIYVIDDHQKSDLDRVEGLNNGYREGIFPVEVRGREMSVQAYLAEDSHIDPELQPYGWYKNYMVMGARMYGLPTSYVDMLTQIPVIRDHDHGRRWMNLGILTGKDMI